MQIFLGKVQKFFDRKNPRFFNVLKAIKVQRRPFKLRFLSEQDTNVGKSVTDRHSVKQITIKMGVNF